MKQQKLVEIMNNLSYSALKDAVEKTDGVTLEEVLDFLSECQEQEE